MPMPGVRGSRVWLLLLQADGFERRRPVAEGLEARDLAIVKVGDRRASGINHRAAVASATPDMPEHEDPLATVSDILHLPSEVLPTLVDRGAVLRPGPWPPVDDAFDGCPHRDDLGA